MMGRISKDGCCHQLHSAWRSRLGSEERERRTRADRDEHRVLSRVEDLEGLLEPKDSLTDALDCGGEPKGVELGGEVLLAFSNELVIAFIRGDAGLADPEDGPLGLVHVEGNVDETLLARTGEPIHTLRRDLIDRLGRRSRAIEAVVGVLVVRAKRVGGVRALDEKESLLWGGRRRLRD